jgi:minor histocompatibility antigen H13
LNPLPLDAFEFSLLGLGDVAIPGLLVALMLRYDASRATDLRGRANAAADAFMEIFATERDALEAGVENRLDGDGDGDFEADGYRSGIGKRAGDAAVLAYDEAGDTSGGTISIPSSLSGRAFFSASLSAYLIGLLVAISANLLTGEGQPALVYLVPVTLGVVAYTAINRGESDRIIEFVDERDSLL